LSPCFSILCYTARYMISRRNNGVFESGKSFFLSRSKIESFVQCPRCFYLDRRLGVAQPPSLPFTLNSAVDALLKKEFDIHRAKGTIHPLTAAYGIPARPFAHADIDAWRDVKRGIAYHHEPTQFTVYGAIDDVWVDDDGKLMIVDYKATSTSAPITLDAEYRKAYKRQIEIYQWLFRKNGFSVSDTGYFVYANGRKDREAFDGKLEFEVHLLAYTGDDSWVEGTIIEAHECLCADTIPPAGKECPFCKYRAQAATVEQ